MKKHRAEIGQAKLALRFHIPSQARSHGNENLEPRITQMDTDNRITQGNAQVTCAGASGPDSLASKLADAPVSESLTRSASGPAFSRFARDEEIAKNWRPEKTRSRPGLPGWRFFLKRNLQACLRGDLQKSRSIRKANLLRDFSAIRVNA